MSNAPVHESSAAAALGGDRVLTIAQADALRAYPDRAGYWIPLAREDGGWHVDYELKDPRLKGGGPPYILDARTGAILAKR